MENSIAHKHNSNVELHISLDPAHVVSSVPDGVPDDITVVAMKTSASVQQRADFVASKNEQIRQTFVHTPS